VNYPTDSDEQCSGKSLCEVAEFSPRELSFRTAKQRTHGTNKKQTSNVLEVDRSHEVMNMLSSGHLDHQLPELDDTSGKIPDP
jgi:hypothetical protein